MHFPLRSFTACISVKGTGFGGSGFLLLVLHAALHHRLGLVAKGFVGTEFLLEEFVLMLVELLVEVVSGQGCAFRCEEVAHGLQAYAEFFDHFIYSDFCHAVL